MALVRLEKASFYGIMRHGKDDLMKYSGKTPLVRAINLEKMLKIKHIYLKLEGANPTHHKYARIAEVLVKDAIAHNKGTIWLDGSKPYMKAIKYFTIKEGIKVKTPRFKHESWKKQLFSPDEIVDMRALDESHRFEILTSMAQKDQAYLAMEGYTHKHILLATLEEITEEITARLSQIDTIYTQSNFGYTLNSMYNVFLKKWIHEEKRFPKIYCGISTKNDLSKAPEINDSQAYIQNDDTLIEISKKAIAESYGESMVIDEAELKAAKNLLRNKEHIFVSKENAYPMAVFLKQLESGHLTNGAHVIVLNDGRSRVDVRSIDDFSGFDFDMVLNYVKTYLAEYKDPDVEIADALSNAINQGYILLAEQNDDNLGICVIVNTQFNEFIPTYHLAYIGTNKKAKGRGIGTELIKQAISKTNGNLSLHVDLDNRNAKKLYEKMGFKHVYNRMIYQSE